MSNERTTAGKTAMTTTRAARYQERAAQITTRAAEANEHNARELYLAAVNTREIYDRVIVPTTTALVRHIRRGDYTKDGAIIAWRNAADAAARMYCAIYCGTGVRVDSVFGVADRCACALELVGQEREAAEFEAARAEGRAE